MSDRHESLAAALAAFQADLPRVGKDSSANTGSYSYKYADLGALAPAVLPALGRQGLSFSCKPTLLDGQFVLVYTLRHESGEQDQGVYPLPSSGNPQAIGSAITYGKRYCLCAVTGVAPDEDDDGAAASTVQQFSRTPQIPQDRPQAAQERPTPSDVARDWDAEIQRLSGDMEGLRDLWRVARAERPNDLALLERIQVAAKAAEQPQLPTADEAVEKMHAALDKAVEPASEKPQTQTQQRRMHKLFGDLGLGGEDSHEERVTVATMIAKRELGSTKDLTAAETDELVVELAKVVRELKDRPTAVEDLLAEAALYRIGDATPSRA